MDIARRAGLPILPLTSLSERQWVLGTWDRLRIPAPFARIRVYYGPPLFSGKSTPESPDKPSFPAMQAALHEQLMELERISHQDCGLPLPEEGLSSAAAEPERARP